jgi:hypothetical protein
MVEPEAHWLEESAAPHPGSPRVAARVTPGHIDLGALERPDRGDTTLGPEAARWAQSLLEVARFELARADDKANTLFRFYGVVAALSIGLLAGQGWSPTALALPAQLTFWAGCLSLLASGLFLGMTLYPRSITGTPSRRLLYFGHVIAFQTVDELAEALRSVDEDAEHRLVEQLLSVSRLVHAKYAMTRKALLALGVGTMLCLVGVGLGAIVK